MTEHSQGSGRARGPFPEGAEPTAPIGAPQPAEASVPPQVPRAAGPAPQEQPDPAASAPPSPGPHGDGPAAPHYSSGPPSPGTPYATPTTPYTYAPAGGGPANAAPTPATGSGPVTGAPVTAPSPESGFTHAASGAGPSSASGIPHPADVTAPYWTNSDPAPISGTTYPAGGATPYRASGDPTPTSGISHPASGVPHPVSGVTHPASGISHPVSGGPVPASGSPFPTSGGSGAHPTSGSPYPGTPSGPPYPTSGAGPAYGPFRGGGGEGTEEQRESWSDTRYGFSAPPGRRIEPSPPPERNRLVLGLLAGLVAGLLLFGTGGFFAGRATAPGVARSGSQAPAPGGGLGLFEQNQASVNQPAFAGTSLTAISEGWLPYLSTCSRPRTNEGEKVRVRCTIDGMSAIFVEYGTLADRDKARGKVLGRVVDSPALTPGVAATTVGPTPSGRTTGTYLEYAYRLTESGTTRTIAGMWWDDAQTPVGVYLLAYWNDGLGEKWEPMRDLWSRYA